MQFASKNPGEYGVDGAVKMWKAVMDGGSEGTQPSPLDNVRQTQQSPTPGGILQGQTPQVKNDRDTAWDAVMRADDKKKF